MRRRIVYGSLVTVVLAVAAILVASRLSEGVNWRIRVLAHKMKGGLPDVPTRNLIEWMRPSSNVSLWGLAEFPNAHSQIRNLLKDRASQEKGEDLFRKRCGLCHEGARGADPVDKSMPNMSDWRFFSMLKWGGGGSAMGPQPLTDLEIWQVHSYLRAKATGEARNAGGQPARPQVQVSPESIASALPSEQWLTYGGDLGGRRHSHLTQISPGNARGLALKWTAPLRPRSTPNQTSPIVANGVLYVSESTEGVAAFDAKTGKKLWQYTRRVPDNLPLCCGTPNRGTAILGDLVFHTTLDDYLVALDANTGKERWIRKVADFNDGYTMTGAPLAFKDRVVIGMAGGEYGVRGFVAAYRAADGQPLWKFSTIPAPGEPGSETWTGDAWKHGGGATWTVGSYDNKLNLVFWGTGNPSPDFRADVRQGDNLYTNSLIALNADTGRLVWHYQFNPADEFDYDAVQQPVLGEINWQGKSTEVVMLASKNGFFYALNRGSGEFLYGKAFAKQTWNAGFEKSGRPIVHPGARPSEKGTLVAPTAGGAANWWPLSYDPKRQLVYVPSVDAAALFFRGDVTFNEGEQWLGSTTQHAANVPTAAAIRAIDANTGDVRWQVLLEEGGSNVSRTVGGVLSTRSGVFFAGYKEEFAAYDSTDGKKLWSVSLGARVSGPPIAFEVDREQRIAVTAGSAVYVFGLP